MPSIGVSCLATKTLRAYFKEPTVTLGELTKVIKHCVSAYKCCELKQASSLDLVKEFVLEHYGLEVWKIATQMIRRRLHIKAIYVSDIIKF